MLNFKLQQIASNCALDIRDDSKEANDDKSTDESKIPDASMSPECMSEKIQTEEHYKLLKENLKKIKMMTKP